MIQVRKQETEDRIPRVSVQHEGAGGALRVLTLATVVALFALIILGGVVRVTGSGLGCPDWPLCHGRIFPSTDSATLIEYSHRLLASVTGLMVLATAVVVWRGYRAERWLIGPMALAVVLLVVQISLGAVTVRTELAPGWVMAHLAAAEVLLACMIVTLVVAWRWAANDQSSNGGGAERAHKPLLMPMAVAGTLGLILVGSYVQASGATGACGDSWPLCQGKLFPGGELPMVHMFHRFLSLLVGVIVLASLVRIWLLKDRQPWLKQLTVLVGSLFLAQILVGAVDVRLAFPTSINILHLAAATAVWASLVALAALSHPLTIEDAEGSNAT